MNIRNLIQFLYCVNKKKLAIFETNRHLHFCINIIIIDAFKILVFLIFVVQIYVI